MAETVMRMDEAKRVLKRPLRFGDAQQLAALDALHACCEQAANGCWDAYVRCELCRMHLCEEHVWIIGERHLCEGCADEEYA